MDIRSFFRGGAAPKKPKSENSEVEKSPVKSAVPSTKAKTPPKAKTLTKVLFNISYFFFLTRILSLLVLFFLSHFAEQNDSIEDVSPKRFSSRSSRLRSLVFLIPLFLALLVLLHLVHIVHLVRFIISGDRSLLILHLLFMIFVYTLAIFSR